MTEQEKALTKQAKIKVLTSALSTIGLTIDDVLLMVNDIKGEKPVETPDKKEGK